MLERLLNMHSSSPFHCSCVIGVVLTLGLASGLRAQEAKGASQAKNAEALAGDWNAVDELQTYFDRLSPARKTFGGSLDRLQIKLVEPKEFWGFRELIPAEERIKKELADANHTIAAYGYLVGTVKDRPLAGVDGYFAVTYCDGETFINALNIDAAALEPWRVHRIAGKAPGAEVLIIEFGHASNRQICAFERTQTGAAD